MTSHPVVVAVVVTYNRRELLQTTLEGIVAGTRVPDAVVIVDNASTDGTAEFLQQYQSPVTIDVVSLNTNVAVPVGLLSVWNGPCWTTVPTTYGSWTTTRNRRRMPSRSIGRLGILPTGNGRAPGLHRKPCCVD